MPPRSRQAGARGNWSVRISPACVTGDVFDYLTISWQWFEKIIIEPAGEGRRFCLVEYP